METLTEVVVLLGVAMVGAALARRLGLLAPIVLVVAGLALSLVPGFPVVRLDPEIVLVGILPPLLYVAAIQTSVPAFRFNLRPILLLAIGLVIFTAFAVGLVVHLLLPGVPFGACVALGAVVAPPDAVAATAVARRIGLPRRIVSILEGESLINDATALVLLRVSIAAAGGGAVGIGDIGGQVLLAAGGGLVIGAVGAVLLGFLHARVKDPVLENALSLISPFLLVLPAEYLHMSGIVAVVVAGLALGHRMPTLLAAESRLQMNAFWRLVTFVLEGLVFLLVGLQLRDVLRNLQTGWQTAAWVTLAVLATVILTRFLWLFPAAFLARLVPRIRRREPPISWRFPAVLAWAGMRGVVTLAAALALPLQLADGTTYPRGLFVGVAFAVIVVTLLLQATTLPAVARLLRLPQDDPTADVLSEAAVQHAASRAARERLDATADGAPTAVVERLRKVIEERSNAAWERLGGEGQETPSEAYSRLRQEMIDAEREVFRVARDEGRIPEEVLVQAQHDLDLEESLLRRRVER
ncbi:sodium/proton antiporter, CPA1 family [Micromonospora pattaloongensis]|uniref:Sodium/proton antiporter, CPA1 family n=1 Tax=Micromonospora pattaloongensis TaxID=405436 RepID=A0A1H3JB20_9ACTN|nr:Na+/H+ antiporter [Micromonospora pattaloongensis]SDY36608.1 sodium/proton antiporter, CPA1 family [Micromonospora pattaloongensis]